MTRIAPSSGTTRLQPWLQAPERVDLQISGPTPTAHWASALQQLLCASRAASSGPTWWNENVAYFAKMESLPASTHYNWDGMKRTANPPFAFFQFTLAGWGVFEDADSDPQKIGPGMGFMATVPSRHRYYLPKESPGWTFGWINVYHEYLAERLRRRISPSSSVVHFKPHCAVLTRALRLIRGSLARDFADYFEVELALFEFVVAYERIASKDAHGRRDSLIEAVRSRVLSDLASPLNVSALAQEYGMSRSHFSRFFRAHTGLTPARVVTQVRVQEATRMLLQSNISLKEIADICGFANANHFNRVFHRYQHVSPGAYRRRY